MVRTKASTYFNLLDCISNSIDLINNNGGFMDVGWYKRVVINDRSLVDEISNNINGSDNKKNNDEVKVDNG